ncbi:hypothetical protein D3C72_997830 [compost metagenome]
MFQRVFQLFQLAHGIAIKQCGKERGFTGKTALLERSCKLGLQLCQTLAIALLLLLQGGELALQGDTVVVDIAPVIGDRLVRRFIFGCGQRVEKRHQGVHLFLKGRQLPLFFLPLIRFGFTQCQPRALFALLRRGESERH